MYLQEVRKWKRFSYWFASKIQENNLSIEDSKSLFNRSEKLLATILSGGDFKSNVDIINRYNSDEDALKAVKIYLSVDPTNSMTPSKKD